MLNENKNIKISFITTILFIALTILPYFFPVLDAKVPIRYFFGLCGIFAFIFFIFEKFLKKGKKFQAPKKSISIEKSVFHEKKASTWWRECTLQKEKSMVVLGVLKITNNSDCEIWLTAIKMKKPKSYGNLFYEGEGGYKGKYGNSVITSGSSTKMAFKFHITPAFIKKGEKFITDLVISELRTFGRI